MGVVSVSGVRVYAYHGVLPGEEITGGPFEVDAEIHADISEGAATDDLTKTIDYGQVIAIIHREMAIRSQLIEHVAHRILEAVTLKFPQAERVIVQVHKLQPPLKAELNRVSVRLES